MYSFRYQQNKAAHQPRSRQQHQTATRDVDENKYEDGVLFDQKQQQHQQQQHEQKFMTQSVGNFVKQKHKHDNFISEAAVNTFIQQKHGGGNQQQQQNNVKKQKAVNVVLKPSQQRVKTSKHQQQQQQQAQQRPMKLHNPLEGSAIYNPNIFNCYGKLNNKIEDPYFIAELNRMADEDRKHHHHHDGSHKHHHHHHKEQQPQQYDHLLFHHNAINSENVSNVYHRINNNVDLPQTNAVLHQIRTLRNAGDVHDKLQMCAQKYHHHLPAFQQQQPHQQQTFTTCLRTSPPQCGERFVYRDELTKQQKKEMQQQQQEQEQQENFFTSQRPHDSQPIISQRRNDHTFFLKPLEEVANLETIDNNQVSTTLLTDVRDYISLMMQESHVNKNTWFLKKMLQNELINSLLVAKQLGCAGLRLLSSQQSKYLHLPRTHKHMNNNNKNVVFDKEEVDDHVLQQQNDDPFVGINPHDIVNSMNNQQKVSYQQQQQQQQYGDNNNNNNNTYLRLMNTPRQEKRWSNKFSKKHNCTKFYQDLDDYEIHQARLRQEGRQAAELRQKLFAENQSWLKNIQKHAHATTRHPFTHQKQTRPRYLTTQSAPHCAEQGDAEPFCHYKPPMHLLKQRPPVTKIFKLKISHKDRHDHTAHQDLVRHKYIPLQLLRSRVVFALNNAKNAKNAATAQQQQEHEQQQKQYKSSSSSSDNKNNTAITPQHHAIVDDIHTGMWYTTRTPKDVKTLQPQQVHGVSPAPKWIYRYSTQNEHMEMIPVTANVLQLLAHARKAFVSNYNQTLYLLKHFSTNKSTCNDVQLMKFIAPPQPDVTISSVGAAPIKKHKTHHRNAVNTTTTQQQQSYKDVMFLLSNATKFKFEQERKQKQLQQQQQQQQHGNQQQQQQQHVQQQQQQQQRYHLSSNYNEQQSENVFNNIYSATNYGLQHDDPSSARAFKFNPILMRAMLDVTAKTFFTASDYVFFQQHRDNTTMKLRYNAKTRHYGRNNTNNNQKKQQRKQQQQQHQQYAQQSQHHHNNNNNNHKHAVVYDYDIFVVQPSQQHVPQQHVQQQQLVQQQQHVQQPAQNHNPHHHHHHRVVSEQDFVYHPPASLYLRYSTYAPPYYGQELRLEKQHKPSFEPTQPQQSYVQQQQKQPFQQSVQQQQKQSVQHPQQQKQPVQQQQKQSVQQPQKQPVQQQQQQKLLNTDSLTHTPNVLTTPDKTIKIRPHIPQQTRYAGGEEEKF